MTRMYRIGRTGIRVSTRRADACWLVPGRARRPGECLVLCCLAFSNTNESDSKLLDSGFTPPDWIRSNSRHSRPVVVAVSKKHPRGRSQRSLQHSVDGTLAPCGADPSDQENPLNPYPSSGLGRGGQKRRKTNQGNG